jgi:phosphoglycerate kinase
MTIATINNVNFQDKRVIVRLDLNLPLHNGRIIDTTRIERILPTLKKILLSNPRYVVILSHLGRPKLKTLKEFSNKDSLRPIAKALQKLLGHSIIFSKAAIGVELKTALEATPNCSVIMAENVRFYSGEEANDANFSKTLASLGDVFVNDAFSCSHRAHSSVVGITQYLDSFAGLSFEAEVTAIETCLEKPERPVIGIVAGSKVSTKIDLLLNLLNKLDYLFLGGGIANNLLCAMGHKMGGSLVENDRLGIAETILQKAKTSKCQLILPTDAIVSNKLIPNAATQIVDIGKIELEQAMYDIGAKTLQKLINTLEICKTVLWNGPVGVYEVPPFANGSIEIAKKIAALTEAQKIKSIVGGGDTLAVISMAKNIKEAKPNFSYISTAGGAFLECLEGKSLPGVEALKKNIK